MCEIGGQRRYVKYLGEMDAMEWSTPSFSSEVKL